MGVLDVPAELKGEALTGPCILAMAPTSAQVPGNLGDILPLVADAQGGYPLVDPWVNLGLTHDDPGYSVNHEEEGIEYSNAGVLFRRITEVERTMTLQLASINSTTVKLIEGGAQVTSLAAAPNRSAQDAIRAGAYRETDPVRLAMIAQRPIDAAKVTEPAPASRSRGALVAIVGLWARLAADERELELANDDPAGFEVAFTLAGDPQEPEETGHVLWLIERPGAIAAA